MKLIIDIPDREYKQRTEFPLCYDSTIDKAIANGTTLEDELEKIKAEIKDREGDDFTAFHFYEIIDNHIAELKGENNGINSI